MKLNYKLKFIFFQAIYDMLGAGAVKPKDTAEERAKNVFLRFVDNLIMFMIDRVVHSYWSRSFKILSSDCSNLIILAPRSML